PVAVVLISASVQFVPGYYYALTLQGMWQVITLGTALPPADVSSLIYNLIQSVFISVAIVLGTLIPLLVFTLRRRWT
ncbi:MAG: hypothetical protein MUE65_07450, partial [Methanomassiliicoccales archaeon]|nr:hypothetical protein [Methanomassiliicoccales archaeon]